jgi:hypothetical protein
MRKTGRECERKSGTVGPVVRAAEVRRRQSCNGSIDSTAGRSLQALTICNLPACNFRSGRSNSVAVQFLGVDSMRTLVCLIVGFLAAEAGATACVECAPSNGLIAEQSPSASSSLPPAITAGRKAGADVLATTSRRPDIRQAGSRRHSTAGRVARSPSMAQNGDDATSCRVCRDRETRRLGHSLLASLQTCRVRLQV